MKAYLNDGRLEIDNNLVENEIRPCAIGKKNFLFSGSGEAGKHSATLYTLYTIAASARRVGRRAKTQAHFRSHPLTRETRACRGGMILTLSRQGTWRDAYVVQDLPCPEAASLILRDWRKAGARPKPRELALSDSQSAFKPEEMASTAR